LPEKGEPGVEVGPPVGAEVVVVELEEDVVVVMGEEVVVGSVEEEEVEVGAGDPDLGW